MLRLSLFCARFGVCLSSLLCRRELTELGAFDIVSEFLPHVSIILYRVYPDSHAFLRRIFRIACITTFTGTIIETILTMYLFGCLWDRWTMAVSLLSLQLAS